MSKTLNAEQSQHVRDFQDGLSGFLEANFFDEKEVGYWHDTAMNYFENLQNDFPEEAKYAKDYYFAELEADNFDELEEAVNGEYDDHREALYSVLIAGHSFESARSFQQLISVLSSQSGLVDSLYDLSTWSPDFDVERGAWK